MPNEPASSHPGKQKRPLTGRFLKKLWKAEEALKHAPTNTTPRSPPVSAAESTPSFGIPHQASQ
jgi:hypothetical protein